MRVGVIDSRRFFQDQRFDSDAFYNFCQKTNLKALFLKIDILTVTRLPISDTKETWKPFLLDRSIYKLGLKTADFKAVDLKIQPGEAGAQVTSFHRPQVAWPRPGRLL